METAAIKNCEIAFGGKNVNEPYILRKPFVILRNRFQEVTNTPMLFRSLMFINILTTVSMSVR